MHFVSANVVVKVPSQSVLFIPSSDADFGRAFAHTAHSRWYINILILVIHCLKIYNVPKITKSHRQQMWEENFEWVTQFWPAWHGSIVWRTVTLAEIGDAQSSVTPRPRYVTSHSLIGHKCWDTTISQQLHGFLPFFLQIRIYLMYGMHEINNM